MEIRDAAAMSSRATQVADGVRVTQLHPATRSEQAVVAVDLWEIEPGSSTPPVAHPEEQVLYVVSGTGELTGGPAVALHPNSVAHIGHYESHGVRNTGRDTLRILVTTPLLVW